MTTPWRQFLDYLATKAGTEQKQYPNTFRPLPEGTRPQRAAVFEPSLLHYPNAYRHGDPQLADPEAVVAWRAARRCAMDHVLTVVAESPWRDHLVLRGSRLMRDWFGDAAREPGDLDWVVIPQGLKKGDAMTREMVELIILRSSQRAAPQGLRFLEADVAMDEIWTYDRVPGCRIVFPWLIPGLPSGSVQFDLVFNEEIPDPPVEEDIATEMGGSASVLAVTPAQSLAWKLMWLHGDIHPQGKDLYDATLLAEHVPLTADLLRRTLATFKESGYLALTLDVIRKWEPDWDNFKLEYPWIPGTGGELVQRLAKALEPTFSVK
jgi:hypothetical protein